MIISRNDKLRILISLVIILLGMLAVSLSYMTFLNPPQCPSDFTQEQVDNSECGVGANIGAGLVWLQGIGMIIIGSLTLVVSIIYSALNRKNQKTNKAQARK